jgi:GH43 family beta-xylosidase
MLRVVLIHLVGLLFLFLAACAEEAEPNVKEEPEEEETKTDSLFFNPILTSGPDPWVFQRNDLYFLTYTTGFNIALYRSNKMSDLSKALKRVVWTPPAEGPNSKNIWAPEIHHVNGKWYIYYAADDGNNDNHKMFALENSSDDPTIGQWVDKGQLELPGDRWAIDGSIFEHNDQLYYVWSGWEGATNGRQDIYICKMDDPLTPTGERILITIPTLSWETNGVNPTVVEAPQMLMKGSKIFMIYSAGGCWTDGYSLGMLTAQSDSDLMNPDSWVKTQNPVFEQYPEGNAFGPGHNGFFTSKDGSEDWIIYHANPYEGQGCGGNRSIRIQPFTWDEEGVPNFGKPHPLYEKQARPAGEY